MFSGFYVRISTAAFHAHIGRKICSIREIYFSLKFIKGKGYIPAETVKPFDMYRSFLCVNVLL